MTGTCSDLPSGRIPSRYEEVPGSESHTSVYQVLVYNSLRLQFAASELSINHSIGRTHSGRICMPGILLYCREVNFSALLPLSVQSLT